MLKLKNSQGITFKHQLLISLPPIQLFFPNLPYLSKRYCNPFTCTSKNAIGMPDCFLFSKTLEILSILVLKYISNVYFWYDCGNNLNGLPASTLATHLQSIPHFRIMFLKHFISFSI